MVPSSIRRCAGACLIAVLLSACTPVARAAGFAAVPFDAASATSIRTLGIVNDAEPEECNVYVFAKVAGQGTLAGDAESLSHIKEFSSLLGVARGGLQAGLVEALKQALQRERGPAGPLEVRMLPRPSGRGLIKIAQAALPTAGTDAVMAFFLRANYTAVKPDGPYRPALVARVVLYETATGKLLYDEQIAAGPEPRYSADAVQVLADSGLPDGGATTLDGLRADPAQAMKAWRAALQPIAERIARDLAPATAPAAPSPSGLTLAADVPTLAAGDKPLNKRVEAAGGKPSPVVVRLGAFRSPYVLRINGGVEWAATRWGVVVPTVLLLDDKLDVVRRIDSRHARVRGGRVEQLVHVTAANAAERYLVVQAADAPPLARWEHVQVTTQKIYARTFTFENHQFADLTGPITTSPVGPVSISAGPAEEPRR